MKTTKYNLLLGAVCISAAILSSCNDEDIVSITPNTTGNEISFGARAGFENGNKGNTRTEYTGEEYTIGSTTYERIKWVENIDKIQIYCEQASAPSDKTVDYVVTSSPTLNGNSYYSTLTRSAKEPAGLQWGATDTQHEFYALYPSPEMLPDSAETTLRQGIKMNGTVVNGFIPISQSGTIEKTGNGYRVKPNMTYAYMVAKSSVDPNVDNGVNLTFYPLVTAVNIRFKLPSGAPSIALEEILLTSIDWVYPGVSEPSTTKPITGSFACNLSGWTPGNTYPSITTPIGGTTGHTINIPLWIKNSSDKFEPMTLTAGQELEVTAFLRPGTEITDLRVALQTTTGITSKVLEGINIQSNTKHIVSGLHLPVITLDYSNWMSYLPNNMPLKDLSIPGTGATFSYQTSQNPDLYKAQTLTLEEQWNAGIRAFEIISERASSSTTSLGGINVDCNGKPTGYTVRDVFEFLLDKLGGNTSTPSKETAVLMLTYQPHSNTRNPTTYIRNLVLLYQNLISTYPASKCFVKYDPSLTLNQVRGKLMILVRPTQHVEDDPHEFDALLNSTYIVEIDGCGTAKDKWGCRGYEVRVANTGDEALDWKTALDIQASGTNGYQANDKTNVDVYPQNWDYPMIENHMYLDLDTKVNPETAPWDRDSVDFQHHIRKKDMHFEYESNISGVKIWCQEWQRVVPGVYDVNGDGKKDGLPVYLGECQGRFGNPHYFYVFWHESYKEKVEAIKKTFDMAISGEYEDQYLFINSLCGYYVTDPQTYPTKNTSILPYADDPCTGYGHSWDTSDINFPSGSYSNGYWNVGGMDGDIPALAKDLNNMLYNHILSKSEIDFTGPTGLVYMNRVTNSYNSEDPGSYYLPGVIISNNFKHN